MDPPLQRHHSSGLAQSKDSLPSLHWIGHCRVTGFPNVEKKLPIEVQLAGKAKEAVAAAIVSAQEWKLPLQSLVEKDVRRQS